MCGGGVVIALVTLSCSERSDLVLVMYFPETKYKLQYFIEQSVRVLLCHRAFICTTCNAIGSANLCTKYMDIGGVSEMVVENSCHAVQFLLLSI